MASEEQLKDNPEVRSIIEAALKGLTAEDFDTNTDPTENYKAAAWAVVYVVRQEVTYIDFLDAVGLLHAIYGETVDLATEEE